MGTHFTPWALTAIPECQSLSPPHSYPSWQDLMTPLLAHPRVRNASRSWAFSAGVGWAPGKGLLMAPGAGSGICRSRECWADALGWVLSPGHTLIAGPQCLHLQKGHAELVWAPVPTCTASAFRVPGMPPPLLAAAPVLPSPAAASSRPPDPTLPCPASVWFPAAMTTWRPGLQLTSRASLFSASRPLLPQSSLPLPPALRPGLPHLQATAQ